MDGVFLALGTNIGDRHRHLTDALNLISTGIGKIIKQSSIHETKAWGNTNQDDFLNMVIRVETELTPLQLLSECQSIEQQLGRIREEKWGPRIIDIDILYYHDEKVNEEHLVIPHPHINERDFVLLPLREIS